VDHDFFSFSFFLMELTIACGCFVLGFIFSKEGTYYLLFIYHKFNSNISNMVTVF
jgi:hypothetical protein